MMVLTKPAHELHSKANLASAISCLGAGGRCAAPPQHYSSPGLKLHCIFDFERSRNQRQGSELF